MRKSTKMGVAALALALSATILAPISANAAVLKNYDAATKTYTYLNEDTNEIVTFKEGEGEVSDSRIMYKQTKAYYVTVKHYEELPTIYTTPDVVKYTDFKSNSKSLKVRMYDLVEQTKAGKARYAYKKNENGETKYYYRDVNGNWQSKTKKELKEIYKGQGRYQLQLFAKKPGKYKVTFNARNAEGAIIANKSITVIARADARAIKSVTYGGKNVLTDTDGDGRADYNNYYATIGGYTTKKKGKLVVTPNKGFKIKKIEVSSCLVTTNNTDDKGWNGTENSSYAQVDLNGNGSTKDIVNNEDERNVSRTWKQIKNKKVLKLSKVDDESAANYNLVDATDNTRTKVRVSSGVMSPTYIRVTYYDTRNHETSRATYSIWYKK